MREQVLATISKHGMLSDVTGIVIGLSGGADSVALAHFLCEHVPAVQIVCVHINHGLRGIDAENDAEFCRTFCQKMGIELVVFNEDVAKIATADGVGIEEAGRKLRYSRFEEVREQYGYDLIAVAHNKNDVAETALMQIFRGSGAIRGISPIRDKVIRPLIAVERSEIEEYCRANALEYCTDATNHDNTHTRNKIRNTLLPMIAQDFNPSVVDALARLSDISTAENDFLDKIAKDFYTKSAMYVQDAVSIDANALSLQDLPIRRRVIRIALANAYDGLHDISFVHIDAVLALIDSASGSQVALPKGLMVSRVYDTICIRKPQVLDTFSVNLSKGETVFLTHHSKHIGLFDHMAKENAFTMLLDCAKIEKMQVRTRLAGDKIYFASVGTKKIKDFFIDKKIPRHQRDTAVFITSGSDVVLMLDGFVKSDKFKPETDSQIVYLQIWDA